mmetsp:Transcript_9644/g.9317  ORF Transcript_9644/g.9317 Transcript_9644/m.9317 type:complete len:100 (+) Transcript_9644:1621-1920(+)
MVHFDEATNGMQFIPGTDEDSISFYDNRILRTMKLKDSENDVVSTVNDKFQYKNYLLEGYISLETSSDTELPQAAFKAGEDPEQILHLKSDEDEYRESA